MKNQNGVRKEEGGNVNSGAAWGWIFAAALPVLLVASILLTALARLFLPFLFLLAWKIRTKNRRYALNAWRFLVAPGLLLAFYGFFIAMQQVRQKPLSVPDMIAGLIAFLGGGLAMVILGGLSRNQSKRFKKYINAIVNEKITSIDVMAANVSATYERVEKELRQMIGIGFFPGAMLDTQARVITLPNEESGFVADTQCTTESTVSCKNCGANNQVAKGVACECSCCEAPLRTW